MNFASTGMHIMSQFPCHNCLERHIGCHSECEKYQRAKDEHTKRREEFHQELSYQAETTRENCYAEHYALSRGSNVGNRCVKRRKKDRK